VPNVGWGERRSELDAQEEEWERSRSRSGRSKWDAWPGVFARGRTEGDDDSEKGKGGSVGLGRERASGVGALWIVLSSAVSCFSSPHILLPSHMLYIPLKSDRLVLSHLSLHILDQSKVHSGTAKGPLLL
jgi:hypothetical protein